MADVSRVEEMIADVRQAKGEGSFVRRPVDPATGREYDRCAYALFPGSQLGAYEPEILIKLYDSLKFQMPDTGVMFMACGTGAKEAGEEELFRECLEDVRNAWETLGRPVLLVACPQCLATLNEELPEIRTVPLYRKLIEMGISGGCNTEKYILLEDDADVRTLAEDMGVEVQPLPEEEAAAEFPYITCSMNARNRLRRQGCDAVHILELIYGMGDGELPESAGRMQNRVDVKETMTQLYWG